MVLISSQKPRRISFLDHSEVRLVCQIFLITGQLRLRSAGFCGPARIITRASDPLIPTGAIVNGIEADRGDLPLVLLYHDYSTIWELTTRQQSNVLPFSMCCVGYIRELAEFPGTRELFAL